MSLQFGAAIGLAAATAINVAATEATGSPQALLDGYQAALVVPVVGALAAVGITALGLVKRSARAGSRSDCTVRLVQ